MATLIRSPELAELRAFCAAVDLGSIGRAARLLRVSQPALSKRLRALETVAGARLLERSPRGVTATAAGARLYAEARKVVARAESVEVLMSGLGRLDEPPIRLASSPTMAEFVLPGPLVEFEGMHERHLSVEVFIANSYILRELVRDGRAEVGVAAVDPTGKREGVLDEVPFCEDEIVVAVPDKHPWARARAIE
ncbi:MAG: LysR family transcriptional regulator, partial [Solirubrobacterales bacterium]|nr:LysR family transcriptional regulator [Solirubrobacterales bacterium]